MSQITMMASKTRLVYNCVHLNIKMNCFGTRRRRNQEERGKMILPDRNTFARGARRRVERRKKLCRWQNISPRSSAEEKMVKIVQEGKVYILAQREREKESGEEKKQPEILMTFSTTSSSFLSTTCLTLVSKFKCKSMVKGSKGGMFCRAQIRNIAKGTMGPRVECSHQSNFF